MSIMDQNLTDISLMYNGQKGNQSGALNFTSFKMDDYIDGKVKFRVKDGYKRMEIKHV